MGDRELRCQGNILFGLVVQGEATGTLEVKCHSRYCGKSSTVVVLHRFDLSTGACQTRAYRQPPERRQNGTRIVSTALRTSGRKGSAD
jgi:hypothetical protein